jgi:hypothetical protein
MDFTYSRTGGEHPVLTVDEIYPGKTSQQPGITEIFLQEAD